MPGRWGYQVLIGVQDLATFKRPARWPALQRSAIMRQGISSTLPQKSTSTGVSLCIHPGIARIGNGYNIVAHRITFPCEMVAHTIPL